VAKDRNGGVRLCPFFEPNAVATTIDNLPDTLAADDSTWCAEATQSPIARRCAYCGIRRPPSFVSRSTLLRRGDQFCGRR